MQVIQNSMLIQVNILKYNPTDNKAHIWTRIIYFI